MKTSQPKTEAARKPRKLKKFMKRKLAFAFGLAALALFVLVLVIANIIRTRGSEYSKTVLGQQDYNSTILPFKRGTIMDRNQTVLAASEQVYNLILDPSVIYSGNENDIAATLAALNAVFGYSADEIGTVLSANPESAYIRYARELSVEQKEAFEAYEEKHREDKKAKGDILGVWFESEFKRVYPYNTLACTLLGFSGIDSSKGNWGLEQYYNNYLVGTNGRSYGYLNQDGVLERTTKEAKDGNTIITTIDYSIQRIVENAIAQFCADKEVDNVGVLVMDPKNAEILAMATNSVYDLNNPTDMSLRYTEEEISDMNDSEKTDALNRMWRNFTISDSFEPGSTAKVFTEAAALEENLIEADTLFDCDGGQQVSDRYIRCSHRHHEINAVEAMGYSCNDAMMQMGKLMGKSVFCQYQTLFGLGNATGIDLPGEADGILYTEDKMSSVDLATNAFGQNFTATMVQIAAGYCSVLNGGSYYKPHIVKQILSADGDILEEVGSSVVRETVSESTSEILKEGLAMVVEDRRGTGKNAQIEGYSIGGKTGTAEKYPRGTNRYVLSFIGFTPAENPELLVYVVVDNPQDSKDKTFKYTVKDTAVPLEQKIMKSLLEYLNVTPATYTNEDGEEITATPETDAEGRIKGTIEPIDRTNDEAWEEEVPEGGFVEGQDDGPPAGKDPELTGDTGEGEGEEGQDAPPAEDGDGGDAEEAGGEDGEDAENAAGEDDEE